MTRRLSYTFTTLTVLTVIGIGLTARGGTVAIVHQAKRAFSVATIQIKRGDTIQFSNDDIFDHQIAIDSPDFSFESPGQPPGSVTPVTFTRAGTFEVTCEIHPRMHLTVTVQ